ncbi:MAG: hypothetical protein QCH96_05155 [Candidatus Thermoplasmatota archaeon]|nr:hypothetical protein [Candidatus Thermoplasmatota archaeon]
MGRSHSNQEGTLAIIAAIIVLFSAMWAPVISVVVSIACLLAYAAYAFLVK